MKSMVEFTRGFSFGMRVPEGCISAIFVGNGLSLGLGMIEGSQLAVSSEDTKKLSTGSYFIQFLGEAGELGRESLEVLPNYSLADEPEPSLSRWKTVLAAVDAAIAGRATQSQLRVSVGDKSIEYCSLAELLSLREFVRGRLKEEESDGHRPRRSRRCQVYLAMSLWRTT